MENPYENNAIYKMEEWVLREFPFVQTRVSVPRKQQMDSWWILNISVEMSLVALIHWRPDHKFKLFNNEIGRSQAPDLITWEAREIIHNLRKLIQNA